METKSLTLDAVEVKIGGEGAYTFEGYASVFGGVDSYGDTILPGAYKSTLGSRERPIQMRWNHWGPVIGKWLEMAEDEKGLKVRGELTPGHSVAEDAYALLKHGSVTGLSIGYRVKSFDEPEPGRRELKEIDLVEISIVESPADNAAQISNVKTAINEADSLKEIESILRDAGRFSRADATALVARIKSLTHGEREAKEKTSDETAAILAQIKMLTARIQ